MQTNEFLEMDAHPYYILMLDPRPLISQGAAHLYQFDVDTAIPPITIPLNGDDKIVFDFDIPYQRTIREELFGYEFVDYRQLPMNFERYNKADQTRIANRMLVVLDAAQRGIDLETGPFPVQSLPLEETLAQINAHQTS